MKRTISTMFFTFAQNNSGGYFIKNDLVSEWVIVEARNSKEAASLMSDICEDYMEYCPCCGERWDLDSEYLKEYDEPRIYGEPFVELFKDEWYSDNIVTIHYYDGEKMSYDLNGEITK